MPSCIKTDTEINIGFEDGSAATIYPSDPRWDDVVAAAKEWDWDTVYQLAFPAKEIEQELEQFKAQIGRVTIEDGVVYFNDTPLHTTLTDRMLEMIRQGDDITAMARFLDNLMNNPSYRAINELYGFLEASNLPITEDGHFYAYKNVRGNYTDVRSGKFDNSVGAVCEMPRNMVDEEKNRTCSAGLHFCGREYLGFFGGERTMMVKINPADVVAIPADHNNMKGRTCRYEVVEELERDDHDRRFPSESIEGAYRPGDLDGDEHFLFDEDLDDEIDYEEDPIDRMFDAHTKVFNVNEAKQRNAEAHANIDDHTFANRFPDAVVSIRPLDNLTINMSMKDRKIARYKTPQHAANSVDGAHASNIRRCISKERRTSGGVEWMSLRDFVSLTNHEAARRESEFPRAPQSVGSWLRRMLKN